MNSSESHPGEILLADYLLPQGVSQNALARAIGVTPRSVNEIVLGRRGITAAMSIRLGLYFDQPPGFWLEMQTRYDLAQAMAEFGAEFSESIEKPVAQLPASKSSIDEDERTTWLL
jgi:addiction module HigA family antidote